MTTIIKRAFHASRVQYKEIVTAVCPGQGNVSKSLFKLVHHEVDVVGDTRWIDLVRHASNVIGGDPRLAAYFSDSTYPVGDQLRTQLEDTTLVQPLVVLATCLNYMIVKDVHGWDVRHADYMLGHSLGELSALVVQGAVSLEDGLVGARRRAELMQRALVGKEWMMCALTFRERDFASIMHVCEDKLGMNIANVNGYEQIVVSGESSVLRGQLRELDAVQQRMVTAGQWKSRIRKTVLQTKIPAHHPVFVDMQDELRESIKINLESLNVPVVCNINGLVVMKNTQRVVDNFVEVTSKPVQFVKCLETIRGLNDDDGHDNDDIFKFVNCSDVTYGLTKRFFKNDKKVQVYDLINV